MGAFKELEAHLPDLSVEVAFATDDPSVEEPAWTDVTADVKDFQVRRGRSTELGQVQAGTAQITLTNRHGHYDPANQSPGDQLVSNPYFLDDTASWTADSGTLERSDEQAATGGHSLKLTPEGGNLTVSTDVAVPEAGEYTLWARAYAPSSLDADDDGFLVSLEGTDLAEDITIDTATRGEWRWVGPHTVDATDQDATDGLTLTVNLAGTHTAGSLYVDHVVVYPGDGVSPHSGGVTPVRQIRVRARHGGTTYGLFRGYVNGWPQTYLGASGKLVDSTVSCVDAFRALRARELTEGLEVPEGPVSTVIGALLDGVGWPAGLRDIGASGIIHTAEHQADETSGQQATFTGPVLGALQRAAATDQGLFFIAGNGDATFFTRHHLYLDQPATPPVFGPAAGEIGYTAIAPEFDESGLVTRAIVRHPTRTQPALVFDTVEYTDTGAETHYGHRDLQVETRCARRTEAEAIAQWIVARNSRPQLRIPRVTAEIAGDDAASLLGLELWDRVSVKRQTGHGQQVTDDYHVEGVQHRYTDKHRWHTTLDLSVAVDPPGGADNVMVFDTGRLGTGVLL